MKLKDYLKNKEILKPERVNSTFFSELFDTKLNYNVINFEKRFGFIALPKVESSFTSGVLFLDNIPFCLFRHSIDLLILDSYDILDEKILKEFGNFIIENLPIPYRVSLIDEIEI